MKEYERQITIINHGLPVKARLKVVRLPKSWYGVIWVSPQRYASVSQDRTDANGGHEHMTDDEFLCRVQLVSSFVQGIDFLYDPDLPQPETKRERRVRRERRVKSKRRSAPKSDPKNDLTEFEFGVPTWEEDIARDKA